MGGFGWVINGLSPLKNPIAHLGLFNKVCMAHTQLTHLPNDFMYVNGQNILQLC